MNHCCGRPSDTKEVNGGLLLKQLEVVGVGPQKTGTSWLYYQLYEHPKLCFPRDVKETFFFDEHFNKGWNWYWSHFHNCADRRLCAEIGPTYFDVPEAAHRIYQHNPGCRIIISLRDPAQRSFSLYLHHRKKGRLHCDFHNAIKKVPRIIDSSHYRRYVSRWIEMFGVEQVLIILLDDISSSPEFVLERVADFIGITYVAATLSPGKAVNEASLPNFAILAWLFTHVASLFRERSVYWPVQLAKKLGVNRIYMGSKGDLPHLNFEIRRYLVQEFESDIAYIEKLLSRSLSKWREA